MTSAALLLALGLASCGDSSSSKTTAAGATTAAGSTGGDFCSPPQNEGASTLCAIQEARQAAVSSGNDDVLEVCRDISDPDWRADCRFQAAEALVAEGDLLPAMTLCNHADAFVQRCRARALWLGTDLPGDPTPSDADADAAVRAFLATLPPMPESLADKDRFAVAQAAAWHSIYAGSGSADPTAARTASEDGAHYAHTAFAWEATRLIGDYSDTEAVLDEVWDIWRGDLEPLAGDPLARPCWKVRLLPTVSTTSGIQAHSAPFYPGGGRFADQDPEADLLIATLYALWTHGADLDPDLVLDLRDSDSTAVQRTAARLIGLMPDDFESIEELYPERSRLRVLAGSTRKTFEKGRTTRPFQLSGADPCP